MKRPSRSLLICAALALIIGIVEPSLEVAWKCRSGQATSEACVWGRSLLPLGRALGLLVVAPIAFGVLLALRGAWRAMRPGSGPG